MMFVEARLLNIGVMRVKYCMILWLACFAHKPFVSAQKTRSAGYTLGCRVRLLPEPGLSYQRQCRNHNRRKELWLHY